MIPTEQAVVVQKKSITVSIVVIVLVVALAIFFIWKQYIAVTTELKNTKTELDSLVATSQIKQIELEGFLAQAQRENEELSEILEEEQEKISDFEKDIKSITKTVDTLEKLSKTDPELLQKYSKVYFLNEHYSPPELAEINTKFLAEKDEEELIHEEVEPFLDDMLEDALDDGINLKIVSAFRSFGEQSSLKSSYKVVYGAGSANQFSADQGYSEHQLGTAIDVTIAISTAFVNFESTAAYEWLLDNAYKYGFVLSYPKNNVYYQFEPWHWRFVGEDLARDLDKKNMFFYDMDQRDIDKYLVGIFD